MLVRSAATAAAAALLLLPPAAARAAGVWTGAGPDANWSTGQNWDDGQPPAAGASLYFPLGSARSVSFNDLPGQTFSRITLAGAAQHTIEGNGFRVTDGLFLSSYIGTVNVPVELASPVEVGSGGFLYLNGPLSGSLDKRGVGTLNLSAPIPSTNLVNVRATGDLKLYFTNLAAPTDMINPSSELTLGFGRFYLNGKPSSSQASSQSFSQTRFLAGDNQILVNANDGVSTTLNLGTLDTAVGPNTTADIVLASHGDFGYTIDDRFSTILTKTPIDPGRGWLTMQGGETWASGGGDGVNPGPIVPLKTFSKTFTPGANVDVPSGVTAAPAGISVGTIRFNTAGGAVTAGDGVSVGGILVTPFSSGTSSIDGGTLSGNDLGLFVHGALGRLLSIGSTIVDRGGATPLPTPLTKVGLGGLVLSGNNTFTGPLAIYGGGFLTVPAVNNVGTPGPLGAGPVLIMGSAKLRYTGGDGSTDRRLEFVDEQGLSSRTIEVVQPSANLTWSGRITASDPLANVADPSIVSPHLINKEGPGTLTLAGSERNEIGGFNVNKGALVLAKAGGGGGDPNPPVALSGIIGAIIRGGASVRIDGTNGDQIADHSGILVYRTYGSPDPDATLDLNGHSETVGFLEGDGRVTSTASIAGPRTLGFAGGNWRPPSFTGVIDDGTSGTTAVKALPGAAVTLAGASTYSGGTEIQGQASVAIGGQGTATSSALGVGPVVVRQGGTLTGDGSFPGDLTVAGTYSPGTTPTPAASVTLPGTVTFQPTGRLQTDIGGKVPGTGHDRVSVGKSATIAGTLELRMPAGFSPSPYDVFDILSSASRTGTFTTVSGVTLPKSAGLSFAVTYSPTDVQVTAALPGDVNLDKVVDGGDFNLLASNFGKTGQTWITADLDGDGLVGAADFNLLASTFGRSATGAPVLISTADRDALQAFAAANVPEPAGVGVVAASLAALTARRRRRRR